MSNLTNNSGNLSLIEKVKEVNENLSGYMPLSGGQMTGILYTNQGVAVSSREYSVTDVATLMESVRYTNGCIGSVNFTTSYTHSDITINVGWYNFIYIPHRFGYDAEKAEKFSDNHKYGCLILIGMTTSVGNIYTVNLQAGSISKITSH